MMGRRNKKGMNYKSLREKKRSKLDFIEGKRLEKLEKAKYRRKLKVRIGLRLKKLACILNLIYLLLGE